MTIKAVCIHVHMSDNGRVLCDAEHSWLPVDVDNMGEFCVTIKAVCIHVHISDNRGTLCDSENC